MAAVLGIDTFALDFVGGGATNGTRLSEVDDWSQYSSWRTKM